MKKILVVLVIVLLSVVGSIIIGLAQGQSTEFGLNCTADEVSGGFNISCSGFMPYNNENPSPTSTNTVAPSPTSTNTVAPSPTSTNTVAPSPTSTNTVAPSPTSTNVSPIATPTNVSPIATPTPDELQARGRAHITGGSIFAENGILIRGDTITADGNGAAEVNSAEFWDNMLNAHLNALRVKVVINPSNCDSACINDFVPPIEGAINQARARGFYTVISLKYMGVISDNGIVPAQNFWGVMAPRYAYYPDIMFDLLDAPCHGDASCFSDSDVLNIKNLYDYVRERAPQTIMYVGGVEYGEGDLLGLAQLLDNVDWYKTALGYSSTYSRDFNDILWARNNGFPVADFEVGNCNSWGYCEGKARGDDVRGISFLWDGGSRYLESGATIAWEADYFTHP